MDSGISSKPAVGAVAIDPVRPVVSVPGAAPTELPRAKTVSPAAATSLVRNDPTLAENATTHDLVLDPQTRELIYRVLDARSRQVLWQVPEEAMLRLRAYAKALANGEKPEGQAQTDVTA